MQAKKIKEITKKLDILISSIEKVYPSPKKLFIRSFLTGLFTALGATVGLSIVIALLTLALTYLKFLPFAGDIIENSQVEEVLPKR